MPPKKVTRREPRVYLYVRCSTNKQDVEAQQQGIAAWLAEKKLTITHTYIDEAVSGTVPWQERKIATVINDSQSGDTIVVAELSRLGRVSSEILTIVDLCTKKGVTILSHKGNWTLDSSIQGKILVMMMSLMSEIERDLISARTVQAMKKAKEAGKRIGGRPPGFVYYDKVLDPRREELEKMLAMGVVQRKIAEAMGCSAAKLTTYIKKHQLGKYKGIPYVPRGKVAPALKAETKEPVEPEPEAELPARGAGVPPERKETAMGAGAIAEAAKMASIIQGAENDDEAE